MLKNFVTPLHLTTKRNYAERMMDNKAVCMSEAQKYNELYWDGDRKFGYGGYHYIPGRWLPVAEALIKSYSLGPKSKVLDVGCGKGFLLHEIKLLLPEITLFGFDISDYAIRNSHSSVKLNLFRHEAQKKYPYEDKYFDLVISLGVLHNLPINDLSSSLSEIERVGRSKYIMTESYRNNHEMFNLQCWALTCKSFYSPEEWKWIFSRFGYFGDYEFIYFE
jgi:SAM-dependent methyltransferase